MTSEKLHLETLLANLEPSVVGLLVCSRLLGGRCNDSGLFTIVGCGFRNVFLWGGGDDGDVVGEGLARALLA